MWHSRDPCDLFIWYKDASQTADHSKEQPLIAPTVAVVSIQDSSQIEPLAAGDFAAIAKTGSKARTNTLVVMGKDYVIAAGAHMSKPVIDDLYKAIAARTKKR
jgi:hypothetical protein